LEAFGKINQDEAKKVVDLLESLVSDYESQGIEISASTIGVITPFRAQIALIRNLMQTRIPKLVDVITVDTVERYQGGARDIIVISLCSNSPYVFESVVNENEDGLDRKLNVALTRAREMLFMIGNRSVINQYGDYKALLEYIDS
jgi:DNA replication ATP-dependent helicase Dna2